MIRSMSYSRYFKMPTPMLAGRAMMPMAKRSLSSFTLPRWLPLLSRGSRYAGSVTAAEAGTPGTAG